MSNENKHDNWQRRDFLKRSAALGLGAPLLASDALGEALPQGKALAPLGQARPVVIASANGATVPKRGVEPRGISCVQRAMDILKAGGDTLDAVVAGVNLVEDDPDDNSVGYGGLPNEECEVELDSSVMHGPSRRAGAVANLHHIKNPSKVAKLILERTDHILLVGEGALRFALKQGFKKEDLLTEESRKAWLAWRESLNPTDAWGPSPLKTAGSGRDKVSQTKLSPEDIALNQWIEEILFNRPTGTINCLALDANGDLSGVTTTSGLAWKIPGRVGDSPLIGCGLYVDNEVGAAGSTGRGEECIYINGAHTVVENMRRGMSPTDAALDAIKRIAHRYGNNQDELRKFDINFYALNKKGEYGAAALWGARPTARGSERRSQFAVHDGKEAKLVDCVHLFERK
ncbi:MAG: N(4)-(beta-N-acetylglucosaminyl)-L-asparaginase [Acidobacteria bacterium]|nr:N(4)-(beta-N-acetylglucosaminyl)-L-asparaginase [Acidobacteriota bacterium]